MEQREWSIEPVLRPGKNVATEGRQRAKGHRAEGRDKHCWRTAPVFAKRLRAGRSLEERYA